MVGRRVLGALAPVLTVLVWPVGVLLLWVLPYWRPRDRVIGTIAVPFGIYLGWWIANGVRTNCESATGQPSQAGAPGCPAPLAYQITHPTPWWGFNHVFGPVLLLMLIGVPLMVGIYLEIRLARGAANPGA